MIASSARRGPVGAPVAWSQTARGPLCDRAFQQITPGALSRLYVCRCACVEGWA